MAMTMLVAVVKILSCSAQMILVDKFKFSKIQRSNFFYLFSGTARVNPFNL